MRPLPELTPSDLAALAERGISRLEAERQLVLLHRPPRAVRLARPATVGDGIERLSAARRAALVARAEGARAAGRLAKFVPASGAATRMFRGLATCLERQGGLARVELVAAAAGGDEPAIEALAFLEALPRLAIRHALAAAAGLSPEELLELSPDEPLRPLFAALLAPAGVGITRIAKALVPFHDAPGGPRSALAEQLAESAGWLDGADRRVRLHLTAPPGGTARFAEEIEHLRERLEPELGVAFEVAYSEQSPATDTLALDAAGELVRTDDGTPLLRPSGHGALLANLAGMGGDLVFVKNIDNVAPAARQRENAPWKLALAGRLLELADEARPARVCGVVPNAGEPGGGPFWVVGADGSESLQIVERAQIDESDAAQRALFASATHFNPVDLVCRLRDRAGAPYDLARFVDPDASFVVRKSEGGRDLVGLERPGLWNGAMARWQTVFVEVPAATFTPVKTILDLARPEHQVE